MPQLGILGRALGAEDPAGRHSIAIRRVDDYLGERSYGPTASGTSPNDATTSPSCAAYDDQDRCIAEGGAAGHMTLHVSYDDAWQVVAEIDPLGAVTHCG